MDRIDLGANVGYSLWRACNENKTEDALKILREGNLNIKSVNYSPSGDTPLDQAITNKNEELLLALLSYGGVSLYHEKYLKNSDLYRWYFDIKKKYLDTKRELDILKTTSNSSSECDTSKKTNTSKNKHSHLHNG